MITIEDNPKVVEFHDELAKVFSLIKGVPEGGLDTNKRRADGSDRPYMRLSDVDQACRAALAEHGFSYPQFPSTRWTDDGKMFISVKTTLCRGGITMEEDSPCELPVLGQRISNKMGGGYGPPDAQSVGSAMTYARRYSLTALLGMCPADDDGHAASSPGEADPDPRWEAFEAQIRRLAAVRKQPGQQGFDAAYKVIKVEADEFPGQSGPDDAQLEALVRAAKRLLDPKPEEPSLGVQLDMVTAKLAHKLAMSTSDAAILVMKNANVKPGGCPTDAQRATLLGAANRLLASSTDDRQNTPGRDGWGAKAQDLLRMMKADHLAAEGETPNENEVRDMRAIIAKVSGIDHRKATEAEFLESTPLLVKEIARRKAP